MKIVFDPIKNQRNIQQRNLPFEQVIQLNWEDAVILEDKRKPYPEPRFNAWASLGERLHVVCFTPISGGIRVISFRKANQREERKYGKR